ncbi:MAG TPA: hypothetical protein VM386_05690, partial [Acidimicrobiales bacterium]|nr:hypothetical protein [Acidimicrobiales bacterium]
MSATRRLAALAAGVLGLSLLTVAPPVSAAEPMLEWTRPTVRESILHEPVPITGTIVGEEGQTIERVSFDLVADPPLDNPDDPCFVEPPDTNMVLDGNRTETFELDIEFPCNGAYQLTATVDYDEPLVGVGGDATRTSKTTESRPFRFSVAIPPAQVKGIEASYDQGTKDVRLTWARSPEPDLLGYFIERNPPGAAGFARIGPDLIPAGQTSFTDPGIDDEHRYQVTAVRRGADPESRLVGEPSSPVAAGPERTQPILPDDLPPPNSRAPSNADGAGGGSRRTSPPSPSRSRTTSNIFEESLPFDPSQTTIPSPESGPTGDAAVLAEFDNTSTDEDRRATLVPIAGGLALVVG